ncbi:MAG TPA: hypothetical protein VNI54_01275 [Thermoanaerobaculia bacterium]|nr:hypothetical protein [Thermoanaerobaculia bacterium]
MRKTLQSAVLLLAMATPVFAASATDFYTTLLRRGVADVEAGRHADAMTNLRLAAFGLLDSIEHYEIAQAYLAVAHNRLGNAAQARVAASRIIDAEKVEKKFRGIALPAAIRTEFETAAKKVLSAAEYEALRGGATAKPSEPVVVDRVDVITEQKPATTKPQATKPPPSNTSTTNPPAKPQAQPKQRETTQPQTSTVTPPKPAPQQQPAKPQPAKPQPAKPQPQVTKPVPEPRATADVPSLFAAADRALGAANVGEARRIYRELSAAPGLDHATLIRLAEGFYRSRDFTNALATFERAGTLRPGEEPYRYYIAVAAFEVRQFDRARRELAAALPFIELTPDVQRYRVKIEAAR